MLIFILIFTVLGIVYLTGGTKYAYMVVTDKDIEFISDYPNGGNANAWAGIIEYLKEIGFTQVTWGTINNKPQNLSSLCDLHLYFFSDHGQREWIHVALYGSGFSRGYPISYHTRLSIHRYGEFFCEELSRTQAKPAELR